jgi:CheY-like chemotaxis protein
MRPVLLIEGVAELRTAICDLLGRHGLPVVASADTAEAIARTSTLSDRPAVILADRRLSGGDGHELLDWIRSRAELDEVPVLLFTFCAPAGEAVR